MTLGDLPPTFWRVTAVILGLLWGSFLNVVIYRLPRGMSVVRPPSHCPGCGTPIRAYRNIPVVSWLAMRGKAPCCGTPVSPRYLAVEIIGGVLAIAVLEALVLPLGPAAPLGRAAALFVVDFALAMGLAAAAFIDLEHMIVPDSISLGGTVLGLGTFALRDMQLVDAAIGAAIGFLMVWLPFDFLYGKLRGKTGMGLGDAKLVMLAGAWFGYPGALFVLGAGAIQGTLVTGAMMLGGATIEEPEAVKRERAELRAELLALPPEERAELERELALDPLMEEPEAGLGKARVAFGPFLILGILECLLIGPNRIVSWILSL